MNGAEFKELLKQYNLTVNQLLDLRDDWNRLPAKERYTLLKQEALESDEIFIKNMFNPSKEYLEEVSSIIKTFDDINIINTKDGFIAEIDKGCCDNW